MIKKCLFVSLVISGFMVASAFAQTMKVAVIDMNQVLKDYHKTVEIEERLKENAATQQKELNDRRDTFAKLMDNYKSLEDELKDKSLSEATRKEKESLIEQKKRDIMARQQENEQFIRQASALLQDQRRRMTEGVMNEIGLVVKDVAKTKGYNLVLVKTEFPGPVLYSDVAEITQDIIKELNKTKGAAAPAPAPEKEKKK